jgi:hypothetical protein
LRGWYFGVATPVASLIDQPCRTLGLERIPLKDPRPIPQRVLRMDFTTLSGQA